VTEAVQCDTDVRSLCYLPAHSHHQRKTEAYVSYSISVPPGFPCPSQCHNLKQSSKAVVFKHLLALDHFI
jgi:hypothetical protein